MQNLWEPGLLAMAACQATLDLWVYISIAAMMADIGSALGTQKPVGAELARDGGVLGDICLRVYISVFAVMAAIGSALTAGHFGKAPK